MARVKPPNSITSSSALARPAAFSRTGSRRAAEHSVLLLEAGGKDSNIWIQMPIGLRHRSTTTAVNWMYQTEPEAASAAAQGIGRGARCWAVRARSTAWSTSAASGRISTTGGRCGNAGWGYDDVLPYFKKAEDQERGADACHGMWRAARRSRDCARRPPLSERSSRPRRRPVPVQRRFQRRDAGRRRLYQITTRGRPPRRRRASAICVRR